MSAAAHAFNVLLIVFERQLSSKLVSSVAGKGTSPFTFGVQLLVFGASSGEPCSSCSGRISGSGDCRMDGWLAGRSCGMLSAGRRTGPGWTGGATSWASNSIMK